MTAEHTAANRAAWDRMAGTYQHIIDAAPSDGYEWGWWRIPDTDIGALGALDGLRVLDLGCGAGQGTRRLAAMGAAVTVGIDLSRVQLSHAAPGADVALVQADAEHLPFHAESFDLVISNWGAMSFANSDSAIPEAARVLRPGGRLIVCTASPMYWLATDDTTEQPSSTLKRSTFDLDRWPGASGTVRFQRSHAGWIKIFHRNGLRVDDLHEPPAPRSAVIPDHLDQQVWRDWITRWPFDAVWIAVKHPTDAHDAAAQ